MDSLHKEIIFRNLNKFTLLLHKIFSIFDVNIEDSNAVAVKNIEVNFIFFARFLLSLH